MFDWERFLADYNIDTSTHGHTTGNIGIRCPWCGDADHGHHLGISLEGRGYFCWRDRAHRGIHPRRLVMALLRCDYETANRIVGSDAGPTPEWQSLSTVVESILSGLQRDPPATGSLTWPEELRALRPSRSAALPYLGYLDVRGFDDPIDVAKTYGLRYALTGLFKHRIILPIYLHGRLVNWTGRAISPLASLRYLTLSSDPASAHKSGMPTAILPTSDVIYLHDDAAAVRGKTLVVVEGPFDALKLNWLGQRSGLVAVAIFGTGNLSSAQVDLLGELAANYERRVLLLDRDAALTAVQLRQRLAHLRFELMTLPPLFADPGELTRRDILKLFG
jgi:hypothetical protein